MADTPNIAATKRFGEIVNTGDLDAFHEVVADGCVDNDPAPDQGTGPEGFKTFFTGMRAAFPDLKVEPRTLVADGDQVAFAYEITGTHKGVFSGVTATGKPIKVRGMQIGRFENGKMVERWGSSDELGILKQIGAAPV
ncbi:ester cyclase [Brevundimonas sp. DC300-4]|uniref:ester cyclase n=1 Tax=Brevundimonas sp. DC300-4 TaxID=2804594 RepID=UPI003CF1A42A